MSHFKDKHYWTQLRAVLTAGQWSARYPAKAPNGAPLPWSELIRKFNKHCTGFKDIADIVTHTRTLALLLATNSLDEEDDNTKCEEHFPIFLGNECVLPEEHVEEARASYTSLKNLQTTNSQSLNFALAYYAYAQGMPQVCLSHLAEVQNMCQIQAHIPMQGTTRSSVLTVPAPSTQASISSGPTMSHSSLFDSSLAEVKDGRSWAMVETLRSICLQGMSHELLSPSDPSRALSSYRSAIPLLDLAATEFGLARSTSPVLTITGGAGLTSFSSFRELWRWADRLIWRAIIICARTSDILCDDSSHSESDEHLWSWLKQYSACSASWPPDFRTAHRSTVSVIYLKALAVKHGRALRASMLAAPVSTRVKKVPAWLSVARSVINDYRGILNHCTHFPRAGERNSRVEDFADLCVAVWEAAGASGDHASWVLDILWWATRLTFNSPSVLRHMTRILYLSGDSSLGRRTLKLYVQVVGKSWETYNHQEGGDADTNDNWVELLVFGIRMLCRNSLSGFGRDEMNDAREAGQLVKKARSRLNNDNKRLVAYVDMAEGIWNTVTAFKEHDPYTRPQRLENAHLFFSRSVEEYPTALGYFYLASSLARTGPAQDLQEAIVQAGMAVEKDPGEVKYWHLLGILLSAAEQWKAAAEILERGAALDDADSPEVTDTSEGTEGEVQSDEDSTPKPPNGSGQMDQPTVQGENSPDNRSSVVLCLLDSNAQRVPDSSDLLGSMLDQCWPMSQESFEHSLQLRLTQVALTEAVEGPEGAEQKWVDVFAWIAAKRGVISEGKKGGSNVAPGSTSGHPSLDISMKPPSIYAPTPVAAPVTQTTVPNDQPVITEEKPTTLVAIPITISPATPLAEQDGPFDQKEKERSSSEKKTPSRSKRSSSLDRGDTSKSKRVQKMLKTGVHKGQVRITTISKKIGHGVSKGGGLRRPSSTSDLHALLQQTSYQASSIHSRRRVSSTMHSHDRTPNDSPPPPPPPPVPPEGQTKRNARVAKENKLLSDVWLMSSATFRRLGRIEQAKGAIQEAEVKDESNAAVWVQLGLYYLALGRRQYANDAFQKALFISPEDISATIHLARLYLMPETSLVDSRRPEGTVTQENVDLAAGLLSHITRGVGWDVPEAWYFLARAYGMQGRKDRERECLAFALDLSERRGVREIGAAIGWCI
ncbi:hypothetical protein AMATHDRAFT_139942 [Amanita thiersii Skay4041]|uniref:Uncharacterized protein n=1 Tax=Amanita thiersii Skay4041 TaxID=703135 RepID=A0A2A9NW22_9AGAR|nr:hypothetical protein AMATHDRAFT_139942 [Amanita thiersii Skay4041]